MGINFLKVNKSNFKTDFFDKSSILPLFESVFNKTNNQDFNNKNTTIKKEYKNHIYLVNCIPPYFNLQISNSKVPPYGFFKVSPRQGFLVDLKGYSSMDDYFSGHFNKKKRITVRRCLKRLEACFNIHHKVYYGEISRETYDFLFDRFESMIRKRFSQKDKSHDNLRNWDYYKKATYSMILEKKASLFVVYDNEKPIDISLNYHHQNILNYAITSYDVDYSKFGLGNVAIYKRLEWCFENGYEIFEMDWGDYPYKRYWSNCIYDYECYVLYNKNHAHKKIMAFMIAMLIKWRKYLRGNIASIKQKAKKALKKESQFLTKQNSGKPIIENKDMTSVVLNENNTKIDINKQEYTFLRKPTYDFQYLNTEHSKDINVYKVYSEAHSFFITGKFKCQKVIYKMLDNGGKST